MKFFDGARPSAYFYGAGLKQDKKTGVRFWRMTMAITMKPAHAMTCGDVIINNYEQIEASENALEEMKLSVDVKDHSVDFFQDEADDVLSVLHLKECAIMDLRLTYSEGITELWVTLEHALTAELNTFVCMYCFRRFWMEFRPVQLSLGDVPAKGDSLPYSGVLEALDKFTEPLRTGELTSLEIATGGKTVKLDKAAADRIHTKAEKELGQ